MQAMLLHSPGSTLVHAELPDPIPGPNEIRVRVAACGVCRTDLHVIDGELSRAKLPLVPGHEIVGRVEAIGPGVSELRLGERVGIPWLGRTCGTCGYCTSGRENLCDSPLFTGYTRDGGYATAAIADARYAFPLGEKGSDSELAPLMCAGLIGWRSLRIAGEAGRLGLFGFGAAAHIVTQVAIRQGRSVFAFTRPGDIAGQEFARRLGASWAGSSAEQPPAPLDAAIIYAPVGELIPVALRRVRKGGRVVCAGIHMSDIPGFPYELLWHEREVVSVANLTRQDGLDFLAYVARCGITAQVRRYALTEANRALGDLRAGRLQGAAVLTI